jgi:hypothetical protein
VSGTNQLVPDTLSGAVGDLFSGLVMTMVVMLVVVMKMVTKIGVVMMMVY